MSEVRNGDQKVQKYIFSEIFYGLQNVHKYLSQSRNILVLLLLIMVGSRSIHYSSCASYMPLIHKKGYGPTDRGIIYVDINSSGCNIHRLRACTRHPANHQDATVSQPTLR